MSSMGRQVSFYAQTLMALPRTLRRYRMETLRLLAEVSMVPVPLP